MERSFIVPFPGNGISPGKKGRRQSGGANEGRYLDIAAEGLPTDTRPILLFDLNGTLTSHTAQRKSAGINLMRPGIHHLMRLHVSTPLADTSGQTGCIFRVKTIS